MGYVYGLIPIVKEVWTSNTGSSTCIVEHQLHASLPIFPELDSAHSVRRLLLPLADGLTLPSSAPCSFDFDKR